MKINVEIYCKYYLDKTVICKKKRKEEDDSELIMHNKNLVSLKVMFTWSLFYNLGQHRFALSDLNERDGM